MALKVKIIADDKLSSGLLGIGKKIGGLGVKFAKFGIIGGAAISGVAVKLSADFSKSLAEVSTLMTDVTEKDIKNMSKELRGLAGATGQGLGPLVKAKYDIVSAGFSDAASSAKLLNQAARLAVGGVTTAAAAADILTTALNAYGQTADEAADFSDILFTTVRLGKTTMNELAGSLGRVLPLAKASNLAFENVGAAMATITAAGLDTFEASTALRGAIKALAAPANEAKTAMQAAGIEVKRFDDGSIDLVNTIKQFEGMDPDTLTNFIPDVRAGTAILSMANNVDKLAQNIEGFADRTGAANTAFEKMSNEFSTKMAQFKNHMHSIMIEIGGVIIDAITPAVDEANKVLETLGDIGWDKVGKAVVENWDLTFSAISQISGVFFSALVPLAKQTFLKVGSVAISSLKLAMSAGAFSISEIIFGGAEKERMAKLVQTFGQEAVGEFVKSIEAGKTDISLLDTDKTIIDIQTMLDQIDDRFVAGSGKFVADAENTGRLVGKFLGENVAQNFNSFMSSSWDVDSLGEIIGTSTEQATIILEEYYARIKELAEQSKDEAPPPGPDPVKTAEAADEIVTTWGDAWTQLALDNAQYNTEVIEGLAVLKEAYQLSTEDIAVIMEDWRTAQKEMNTLSHEEQLANISSITDQRKIAIATQIKDEKLRQVEIDKLSKWEIEQKKRVTDDKNALVTQGYQHAASALTSLASINKGASKANFMVWKRTSQVQAMVDTYASATAAYKALAGIPVVGPALGAAAAAAAIAAGLANVSRIEAQTFQFGGTVREDAGMRDTVPALLRPREIVSTPEANDLFGDEISQMNQIADGGGSDSQLSESITIHAVDSESLEDSLKRNPMAVRDAIKELKEDGFLTGVID